MARTRSGGSGGGALECLQNFFEKCGGKYPDDLPDEQCEYFPFQPLLLAEHEIPAGSETSSETSESDASARETPVVEIPKQSVLEALFTKEAAGGRVMSGQQTAQLARKLGLAPSHEDEERLKERHGDQVNFDQFVDWMQGVQHTEDTPDFMRKFFEHFDEDRTGNITKRQLQHILMSYGGPDALTEEECREFMKCKQITGDNVNYKDLVDTVLEKPANDMDG